MIGQLLSTTASIIYSGDVAKAINFIGRRPGYGSSVPVTVAFVATSYPMPRVSRSCASQTNTLLTAVVARMPAAG